MTHLKNGWITTGHELCHSFEWEYGLGIKWNNPMARDRWIEKTCDGFSFRWLESNSNYNNLRDIFVEYFIEEKRRFIRVDEI